MESILFCIGPGGWRPFLYELEFHEFARPASLSPSVTLNFEYPSQYIIIKPAAGPGRADLDAPGQPSFMHFSYTLSMTGLLIFIRHLLFEIPAVNPAAWPNSARLPRRIGFLLEGLALFLEGDAWPRRAWTFCPCNVS